MPICHIYNNKGVELIHFNTESYPDLERIEVGRSSSCEVSLKRVAESSISRRHFYLQRHADGSWSIHDTSSRAGIVINCEKVREAPLHNGTIVRFGQLFFGFGSKGVPSPFILTWHNEDANMTEFGVLWEGVNSVGASHDNYVTVRLGQVSRFQCKITVKGSTITVEPFSSMTPIYINEERVENRVIVGVDTLITLTDIDTHLEMSQLPSNYSTTVGISSENATAVQSGNATKNVASPQNLQTTQSLLIGLAIIAAIILFAFFLVQLIPGFTTSAKPVTPPSPRYVLHSPSASSLYGG
ncbi:MAG: FHA domain-containing protein [Victivallales bacterium]|nr:FHA domain-containing protein [Victivallales bacterium]